uniref:Uncharacterized protein n=1 Tax=viral metagenome TaxID=1070528 RepID=A0A6C0IJD6_9ZZZZ
MSYSSYGSSPYGSSPYGDYHSSDYGSSSKQSFFENAMNGNLANLQIRLSERPAIDVNEVNINYFNNYHRRFTPFMVALRYGQLEVVRLLIEYGADVNMSEKPSGNTPLHLALEMPNVNNIEIVQLLLSRGSNPNTPNNYGVTPIQLAQQIGNTDIVNIIERWPTLSTIPILQDLNIYNSLDLGNIVDDLHQYRVGPPLKGGRGKRRKTRKTMKKRKTLKNKINF